jgi:hypothetical protein
VDPNGGLTEFSALVPPFCHPIHHDTDELDPQCSQEARGYQDLTMNESMRATHGSLFLFCVL